MELNHIKDLTPDPKNLRKHTSRNIGMLVDALHKVGAGRSIVIDEHGEVLAGNGVVEAAAEAGITKVQVVDADGSTVIAVRRTGLSAEQKRELAIYDNRVAELAEWDAGQLQADLDAGLDLKPWFSDQELDRVMTDSFLAMAAVAADTVAPAETSAEDVRTFTCPLTVDQERIIRAGLRTAKTQYGVSTTGGALTAIVRAWAEGRA